MWVLETKSSNQKNESSDKLNDHRWIKMKYISVCFSEELECLNTLFIFTWDTGRPVLLPIVVSIRKDRSNNRKLFTGERLVESLFVCLNQNIKFLFSFQTFSSNNILSSIQTAWLLLCWMTFTIFCYYLILCAFRSQFSIYVLATLLWSGNFGSSYNNLNKAHKYHCAWICACDNQANTFSFSGVKCFDEKHAHTHTAVSTRGTEYIHG